MAKQTRSLLNWDFNILMGLRLLVSPGESGLGGSIMFKLSSDMRKCKFLWEGLNSVLSSDDVPWLVIGDFNAIIYSIKKKGGGMKRKGIQISIILLNLHNFMI
ncbi:hypothetical protein Gotur_014405 [Gossypium turneri]